jgi:hypothetical protein
MPGNLKDYGKKAHHRASDYGRRAQEKTRQKSYRKTIGIVVGMLVVLVAAGVAIPHVLPQGLQADEVLAGRGGGFSILSLSGGTGKEILVPPPRNEAYTTWALSLDRSMFLAAWCHEQTAGDPSSADSMALQLHSSYSGGQRWQYPLDTRQVSAADLQIGYIPGTKDIWLLSRGRLWIMDDRSGATRAVSVPPDGLLLTRVAFSSDGRTVAYSGAASGGALLLAVSDFDGSKISNPEFLNPPIPPGAGTPPVLGTANWVGRDILALSMVSKNEIAVAQRSADATRVVGQGQYSVSIARLTREANERWVVVPVEGSISSMSASPDRKSLLVWVTGPQSQYVTLVQTGTGQLSSAAANPSRKVEVDASQGWRAPAAWSAL